MRRPASIFSVFLFLCLLEPPARAGAEDLTVEIDATAIPVRVIPAEALGAALDGGQKGDIDRVYHPASVKEMASVPFHRVTYRLRTELSGEVWHWSADGTWSDPGHSQGYWVSNVKAEKPIRVSYGFRLPRRGNTHDQANQDGFSRLSDGDPAGFWKSNPYLDQHFTGEDNAANPQWVLINFEKRTRIGGLRILWADPYATEYEVQYFDGGLAKYYNTLKGRWRTFQNGKIVGGTGGDVLLPLSDTPVETYYLRILLKKSSGTAAAGSTDIRDGLGFAIRELYAGELDAKGNLSDRIVHAADGSTQTKMLTSSTDPWHRATDRDENVEQPGLDLIMQSALTHGKDVLVPTGVLYDTPENAAAEISFLKARGYDIRQIEIGEEPDGQYVTPEHYGALFIQFADAIRKANPEAVAGGPSLVQGGGDFRSEVEGWDNVPGSAGERPWMKRFLSYLIARKRSSVFGFFSFEWYPFDDLCKDEPSKQLMDHPDLVDAAFKRFEDYGVSRQIPWIITEYGYSSFSGQPEVELPAALLNAEVVARFLMRGVKTAHLFSIEPNSLVKGLQECETWGNQMALQTGPNGKVSWHLPTYYGAKLYGGEWFGEPSGLHRLYPARLAGGLASQIGLTAYALQRPDNRWSLLILNKEPARSPTVAVTIKDAELREKSWLGPHEVFQYSPRQYEWQPNGGAGHPKFSRPPARWQTPGGSPLALVLPPMSLTVVRDLHKPD